MKKSKQAHYDKYFEKNIGITLRIHGKESHPLFF